MLFNEQITDQFINKLFTETNSQYFEKLLEYLSLGEIISTESQIDVIEKYYHKYYDTLLQDSHLNMVQIITTYQIMHGKPLIMPRHFRLNEPAFYKTVNKLMLDGKEYTIPYQESFTLNYEPQVPQYKIYARSACQDDNANSDEMYLQNQEESESASTTGTQQNSNPLVEANNEFNNQIGFKVHEYIKGLCYYHNQYKYQTKYLNRFYLYFLMTQKKLNETPYAEEERIINEFKQNQQQYQILIKQSENYSNFLIDFQTLLNDQNDQVSHEINYSGEDSKRIVIDIAVRFNNSEQKIGFIFVDEALTRVGSNDDKQFSMSSLTRMKIELLEKHHGWTIYPIYYERWVQTFNNHSAKETFISKAIAHSQSS